LEVAIRLFRTPSPCEYAKLWAWFAETKVQSHSNGLATEPARVKWEMSAYRTLARFRSLFCLCANICPAEFEDNFQCCSSSVTRLFTQPGEGQVGVADVSPL
jgi:hypothetical protein